MGVAGVNGLFMGVPTSKLLNSVGSLKVLIDPSVCLV